MTELREIPVPSYITNHVTRHSAVYGLVMIGEWGNALWVFRANTMTSEPCWTSLRKANEDDRRIWRELRQEGLRCG